MCLAWRLSSKKSRVSQQSQIYHIRRTMSAFALNKGTENLETPPSGKREGEKETQTGGLVLIPHYSCMVYRQSRESWDLYGKLTNIWRGFSHPSLSSNKIEEVGICWVSRKDLDEECLQELWLNHGYNWVNSLQFVLNTYVYVLIILLCEWLWWVGCA